MNWKKISYGGLIFDLVVINGVIGLLTYKFMIQSPKPQMVSGNQVPNTMISDICGEQCQKYIDQKFAAMITPALPAGPSATPAISLAVPVVVKPAPTRTKVRSVTYVTIPGSGSTMNNAWTDLTGTEFYFDPTDYPGLVEVYFEANIRLFNGNGMAYVRLVDTTHGIGVQGSDVQTNNQASGVVVSGKISFWSGKNLIRVQAKSLTADTAIFDSGRLRIVVEN